MDLPLKELIIFESKYDGVWNDRAQKFKIKFFEPSHILI